MENGSDLHNKQESIIEFGLDGDVAWTQPLMGWVKANVDAAIFQNQGRIRTGCIVRDSAGAMIMARTMNIMGAYLVRKARAMSLREAITWLKRKQVDKCIIETDSTQVIVALNDTPKQSLFHLIIDDCKHLLRSFRQMQVLSSDLRME